MEVRTEKRKFNTRLYQRHHTEDGILDIMLGVIMLVFGLSNLANMISLVGCFAVILPLLGQSLKLKYVYPRIGINIYDANRKQKRKYIIWLISGLLSAGILGFIVANLYTSAFNLSNPLFNVMGVLISGLIIMGGISRQNRFYIYAIFLAVPIAIMQLMHGLWLGTIMLAALILIILSVFYLIITKHAISEPVDINKRPSVIAHSVLMEAGLIFFTYFLVAAYIPAFAKWLKYLVESNSAMIFGNVFALIIMCFGIAFMASRFYLYGTLISVSVILPEFVNSYLLRPVYLFMLVGLTIIISGIGLLIRFVHQNQIWEDNPGKSTATFRP